MSVAALARGALLSFQARFNDHPVPTVIGVALAFKLR
jgi:hypothetical protein